jgi:hypothetical protein
MSKKSALKKEQLAVPSTAAETSPALTSDRFPSVRAALWIVLLAMLAILGSLLALRPIVDIVLLRVIGALILLGIAVGYIVVVGLPVIPLLGMRPKSLQLVLAVTAGVALWFPVWWLIVLVNATFNTLIGFLPPILPITTSASPFVVLLQVGLLIPLVQGLIFLGLVRRALGDSLLSVVGVAVLLGAFSLVTTEFAYSGIIGYFLVGFVGALVAYLCRSAWVGSFVLVGFGLVRPILEAFGLGRSLFGYLFPAGVAPDEALFGGRWIIVVVSGLFIAFSCTQILRVTSEPRSAESSVPRSSLSAAGRWWQVPLVLIVALCLFIGYSEVVTRSTTPRPRSTAPSSLLP